MPRVSTKKKNKVGEYRCDRCAEPIIGGQQYFEWSFRYGGTHRQHTTHGSPKQSQLTQSKLSGAYAAIEAAEEAIGNADNVEDIRSALEECATEIENVKDEYQDSFDNIPENLQQGGPAQEMQEKIEALESFSSELSDAAVNLEDFSEDEPEEPVREAANTDEQFEREHEEWETEHAAWQEKHDEHLDEQRGAAEEALGNLSV